MPCDYEKYPPNFKSEIRPRILARAGNKCEICLVPNGSMVARGTWDGEPCWQDDNGIICSANDGRPIGSGYCGDLDGPVTSWPVIVLTIAHIENPDPMDCRDENLKALCQRCHNHLDLKMRQSNAAITRLKNKKQIPLF